MKHPYWISPSVKMCMAALLSTGLVFPLSSTSAAQDPHFLSVQQQMQTVKGVVVDNNGEPVIGATISIGGKAVKITDIDGKFVVQTHANELITITCGLLNQESKGHSGARNAHRYG